jgi:hypothetical protein
VIVIDSLTASSARAPPAASASVAATTSDGKNRRPNPWSAQTFIAGTAPFLGREWIGKELGNRGVFVNLKAEY